MAWSEGHTWTLRVRAVEEEAEFKLTVFSGNALLSWEAGQNHRVALRDGTVRIAFGDSGRTALLPMEGQGEGEGEGEATGGAGEGAREVNGWLGCRGDVHARFPSLVLGLALGPRRRCPGRASQS